MHASSCCHAKGFRLEGGSRGGRKGGRDGGRGEGGMRKSGPFTYMWMYIISLSQN